ncbi:MAG: triose-phosphate isomerase [Rhabdochlamydiaceae bacterium]
MKQRIPTIVANWKMHKTQEEAKKYILDFLPLVSASPVNVLIAAPFTCLSIIAEHLKHSSILVGGQNMHFETDGAYTGEISLPMLKDVGASFVILGHSERRTHFLETDLVINKKLNKALQNDMKAILCIGEQEIEKKSNKTLETLKNQISNGLKGIDPLSLRQLIIAYEPVWAIGTGQSPHADIVQEIHAFIRAFIQKEYGDDLSSCLPIIYGGSVKYESLSDLMLKEDVDGVLVGGASLDPQSFAKIVNFSLG